MTNTAKYVNITSSQDQKQDIPQTLCWQDGLLAFWGRIEETTLPKDVSDTLKQQ